VCFEWHHKTLAQEASGQGALPALPPSFVWVCLALIPPQVRRAPTPPLILPPSLPPSLLAQWERGFILFYLNRIKEAADQFAWCTSLDPDDCEPFLWRCLVSGGEERGERVLSGLSDLCVVYVSIFFIFLVSV